MNRRALLGLFSIISLIALFGVYIVLTDFLTRTKGYRLGIRFPSAAGLATGSLVYESGVVVGSVDAINLLSDYSSEVIVVLRSNVNVPSNARFMIVQPLQGDPTLRILPLPSRPAPPFAHRLLPVSQQPVGLATISLPEFLAQGQDQVMRVDNLLAQLQHRAPRLLDAMQEAVENGTKLTKDADRSLVSVAASSRLLIAQLSASISIASSNMIDLTARLDAATKTGEPRVERITAQLDLASRELAESIDALHKIAADPALHENIIATTSSLAQTSAAFSSLLNDLRKVTGDEQTQARLRNIVTNLDSATQRADSLLGTLGGKSTVPRSVQPEPHALIPPVPSGREGAPALASPRPSLFGVQVRMSGLSPEHHDAHGAPLNSRLLDRDRGPQTDLALIALPRAPTSLLLGVNDIGNNSTVTLEALRRRGAVSYGGGLLYSTLGVTGSVVGERLGLSTDLYDPRHGFVDVYGKLFTDKSHDATIFVGERDLTHDSRRNIFGLQLNF
jgi:hypothetical protein